MAEEQKCTIFYKVGFTPSGNRFGERLDRLESCCDQFKEIFFSTGNEKNSSWETSNLFDEKPGLNLLRKEGEINLFLCGKVISFCPWSGHPVEAKKSREVVVTQKYVYEESELPEGGKQ